MARSTKTNAELPKSWFAPPGGFYRGVAPGGETVERTGLPPDLPVTPEGVRRLEEEHARRAAERAG